MIGSTRSLRVWAYPAPADLRKGFDGLSGLVLGSLNRDPVSGDCYLFVNRTRTSAKVLLWDGPQALPHRFGEHRIFNDSAADEFLRGTRLQVACYLTCGA